MIVSIKDIEFTENVYNQIITLYNRLGDIDHNVVTFKQLKTIILNLPKTHNIYLYMLDNTIVAGITLLIEQKIYNNMEKIANIRDCVILIDYKDNNIHKHLLDYVTKESQKKKCSKLNIECKMFLEKWYTNLGFIKEGIYMTKLLS